MALLGGQELGGFTCSMWRNQIRILILAMGESTWLPLPRGIPLELYSKNGSQDFAKVCSEEFWMANPFCVFTKSFVWLKTLWFPSATLSIWRRIVGSSAVGSDVFVLHLVLTSRYESHSLGAHANFLDAHLNSVRGVRSLGLVSDRSNLTSDRAGRWFHTTSVRRLWKASEASHGCETFLKC